ncbi:hypothetical protein PHET_11243 [Paragonimus heterotremus]|uniref:Dolichyl-diphosphooligosaccharide--protein glycosyltransferase subunit STT3A n=1 Tax=Paragonimus heterotremus TaxID=100268 RepID=A0A8J4WTC0_9TREM|nr:hypothetical protein PHET_11243 [Paragonimus heterotremus]
MFGSKVNSWLAVDRQLSLIQLGVLVFSAIIAFSIRLFAVIRFESIIHEFDPYFNYRTTRFMTEHGFYKFHDWFDDMAWYPLGRIIGGTIYPGVHLIVHSSCLQASTSLTTLITFLLTREVKDTSAGLLAAALVAVVPGYISRSVAGSYDNEGIAIFCMLFTFYLWVKAVKTGSVIWASACSLAYFYMAFGVFGLCQLVTFYGYLQSKMTSENFRKLLRIIGILFVAAVAIAGSVLAVSGKIAPWSGRFYSLLDPTYAKNHIPIIASVSEHQPTSWSSYYFDMQMLTVMFPVGLYYLFKQPTVEGIFIMTYGITSLYFSVSNFITLPTFVRHFIPNFQLPFVHRPPPVYSAFLFI